MDRPSGFDILLRTLLKKGIITEEELQVTKGEMMKEYIAWRKEQEAMARGFKDREDMA